MNSIFWIAHFSIYLNLFANSENVNNVNDHILVNKDGLKIEDVFPININGSSLANITDFPHTAQLKLRHIHPIRSIVYCVGTIIGSRWIISSAACNVNKTLMSVLVGSAELFNGTEYNVSAIYLMPVDEDTFQRIMLVETKERLTYSINVYPIRLAGNKTAENMVDGIIGNVTGFGNVIERDRLTYSPKLRVMQLSIMTYSTCLRNHKEYEPLTTPADFCASYPPEESNKRSICYGNRGVPFIVNNELVGIATVIRRCGKNYLPSVFVSVPFASGWICNVTNIWPYLDET